MSLRTWRNQEKGEVVKRIIDNNFQVLGKYLPKHILSLSSEERKLIGNDYLSKGLLVFDTDEFQWYQYDGKAWNEYRIENDTIPSFSYVFNAFSWSNGEIPISFEKHQIKSPMVQVYIKEGDSYIPVIGGYRIDDSFNVTIESDLSFNGKAVIK